MSNDIILPKIDPIGYIRTYVPYLWGAILGWLFTKIPAVADAITGLEALLVENGIDFDWRSVLNTVSILGVTYAYYWVARQIGRRWPALEKWLVGSSSLPIYVERHPS